MSERERGTVYGLHAHLTSAVFLCRHPADHESGYADGDVSEHAAWQAAAARAVGARAAWATLAIRAARAPCATAGPGVAAARGSVRVAAAGTLAVCATLTVWAAGAVRLPARAFGTGGRSAKAGTVSSRYKRADHALAVVAALALAISLLGALARCLIAGRRHDRFLAGQGDFNLCDTSHSLEGALDGTRAAAARHLSRDFQDVLRHREQRQTRQRG